MENQKDPTVMELSYKIYTILANKLNESSCVSLEHVTDFGYYKIMPSLEKSCKDRQESKLIMALINYIYLSWYVHSEYISEKKFVARKRHHNMMTRILLRFKHAHHNLMMQLESSSAKSKKGKTLEIYDSVKHLSFPTFDQTNGFHVPQVKIKETKSKIDILTLSEVSGDGKTPNMVLHASHRVRFFTGETMDELKSALEHLISKGILANEGQIDNLRSICCSQLFCSIECKNPSTKKVLGSMSFDTYCDSNNLVTTQVELEFCVKDTRDGKDRKEHKLRSSAKTITRLLVTAADKDWYNYMCGLRITELLIESKLCVFCHDSKCTFAAIPYRYTEVKGESSARCPNGYIFCTSCNKKAHGGPCALDPHDEMWLAENKSNMMCPSCRARIQKDGGCNHMYHKICNTHFCATCFRIFPGNVQWTDHTGCNQFPPSERVNEDIEDSDDD